MRFNKRHVTLVLGACLLASIDAQAQVAGSATGVPEASAARRGYAGASFGSPMAFGAGWGSVGMGIVGQTIDTPTDDVDGAMGISFGLGDPNRWIGLETSVVLSSLTGANNSSFGENGAFGVKLHTNLPTGTAFALGVSGVAPWGLNRDIDPSTGRRNVESSVYAVATQVVGLGRHPLVASLGVGDTVFNEPGEDGANLFGSVAFYFTRQLSVIAEHTGRFTNLAVSAAPFGSMPVTVTLAAINVGERYNDHTQFGASIGYGFSY